MFIHPKIAASEPVKSPIEGVLTPLYSDLGKSAARAAAPAPAAGGVGEPSKNGHAGSESLDSDALVKAITDQVMAALNGAVR
jgi:hypothetical protein